MADKFLGFVKDIIPSNDDTKGKNAFLKVIAIKENGNYRKLTSDEAKQYCPPNGEVFGAQFFKTDNSDFYDGPFIEFETKPNQETDRIIINKTDYIVNYVPRPKAINLPRLVIYNGKINQILLKGYLSPNEINTTIDKQNVFDGKNGKFFLYDSVEQKGIGFFKYQNSTDTIESNFGKDVQEFKILNNYVVSDKDGRSYLLFNERQNTLERGSIIDFMTNQQLEDWLKTKIKDIASIDKKTLSLICNLPESQSAEDDRDASRYERLKDKADAFDINVQTLVDLICTHPKYFNQYVDNIDLIEKEVKERLEKKFITEASGTIKENQEKIRLLEDEILKLDDKLKSEKEKISYEVEKTRVKLEKDNIKLDTQIKEKNEQLKRLNENYDSIIATISAIVPVFNKPLKETFELEYELCKVDFPKDENARSFSKIKEDDEETFVSFLKRHVCYENEKLNEYLKQVKKIFSHKACFIPNTALAYLFAKALRNTEVIILHIEHDWLHYSDFKKHRLLEVFQTANNNPEKNYILVLDGLNVTQPECGLRPLLNLINEDIPILEGCNLAFPQNLTIMATLFSSVEEHAVGLKLNPAYYTNWFAIGDPKNEEDKISLPDNFWNDEIIDNCGYVEPSDLKKLTTNEKSEALDKYLNY